MNIDLPPEEGVASGTSRPDIEADILMVDCEPATVREIRLHHVFEHFERAVALALLVRWHDWLEPNGKLVLETPDFETCVEGFSDRSIQEQQVILRHLFGSQEADWARHLDGWSRRRFEHVLGELDFRDATFERTQSDELGLLAKLVVSARRGGMSRQARVEGALRLLRMSMNGDNPTERELLARWVRTFDQALAPLPGG